MPSFLRPVIATMLAVAALVLVAMAPATAGGRPFTVDLTGEAEVNAAGVPNQGDLDGSGTAVLRVNPGLEQVCWTITVSGIDAVISAHIHEAPATTTGPPVVTLAPYTDGCTDVDRELALDIIRNPSDYYVNVHTATFPGGALRGQLG